MKIAGHYDGRVVVLDEAVALPVGTRVEVSVAETAASWEQRLARAKPGEMLQHPSGMWLRKGEGAQEVLRVLREIWASEDNSWRNVGDDYAEKLREQTQRPRYSL